MTLPGCIPGYKQVDAVSNALLVMLLCLTCGADEQIQRIVNETIAENIAVLRAISDVVITLGRQSLPFRGHRDDKHYHDVPNNHPETLSP